MDTALPQKFPFILDRNLAKANCTGNQVCTSCDTVVPDRYINMLHNSEIPFKFFSHPPVLTAVNKTAAILGHNNTFWKKILYGQHFMNN